MPSMLCVAVLRFFDLLILDQTLAAIEALTQTFLQSATGNASCSHVILTYAGKTLISLGSGLCT